MSLQEPAEKREQRINELTRWGREIVLQVRSYPSDGLKSRLMIEATRRYHSTREAARDLAEVVIEVLRSEYENGEIF